MTKKDYIADAIRGHTNIIGVQKLCKVFQEDNNNFNQSKFLHYLYGYNTDV